MDSLIESMRAASVDPQDNSSEKDEQRDTSWTSQSSRSPSVPTLSNVVYWHSSTPNPDLDHQAAPPPAVSLSPDPQNNNRWGKSRKADSVSSSVSSETEGGARTPPPPKKNVVEHVFRSPKKSKTRGIHHSSPSEGSTSSSQSSRFGFGNAQWLDAFCKLNRIFKETSTSAESKHQAMVPFLQWNIQDCSSIPSIGWLEMNVLEEVRVSARGHMTLIHSCPLPMQKRPRMARLASVFLSHYNAEAAKEMFRSLEARTQLELLVKTVSDIHKQWSAKDGLN